MEIPAPSGVSQRTLSLVVVLILTTSCSQSEPNAQARSEENDPTASVSSEAGYSGVEGPSCTGPREHPDADKDQVLRILSGIDKFLRSERHRELLGMRKPRMKELIYAVHPLKQAGEIAAVFRVVDDKSAKKRLVALSLRHQNGRFAAQDSVGLIPPRFGRLGKGLVNLGQSLFLGYVLEYGRSYSSKVSSVKIVETLPEGRRNVDTAPLFSGAFLIVKRQRNADSMLVSIRGRGGRNLERVRVDLRIRY